jgi:hypothetical protein
MRIIWPKTRQSLADWINRTSNLKKRAPEPGFFSQGANPAVDKFQ